MIKLLLGDCRELTKSINDNSIDLILTDPPYIKKYLYLYEWLAEEGARILKPGGSLITIVGHYAVPTIIKMFDGKLKWRWIFNMNQMSGRHARMAMGIEVTWKPILWYVKKAYPNGRGFIKDGFDVTGKAGQKKKLHKWEQDISWANFFVSKLTKAGDTVFDPFMGSGTTGVSCVNLHRNFIGMEIDAESYKTAKDRVERLGKE